MENDKIMNQRNIYQFAKILKILSMEARQREDGDGRNETFRV